MKIRMTASMVGTGFSVEPGEETDRFSDAEALRMIEAGYAVPVAEAPAAIAKRDAKARRPKAETR